MTNKTKMVYELIQEKATSNEVMQGFSGVLGFPFTLVVDAGIIFTHYGPLLNDIRKIYGRTPLSSEVVGPILNACKSEVLSDLIVDKLIGQLPMIGIAANIMCAKTMTWRLGLLFAMLASRGEDVSEANAMNCVRLIRKVFPQTNMLKFKTPSLTVVEKLLDTVENNTVEDFDSKVVRILDAL